MWFMLILWKSFRGLWRLVVGLIIGVILYIYTFTTPGLEWIFNDVYTFTNAIVGWMSEQSWYPKYEKWDHLVKPGDRLPLILYILVGRFIWLMFEAVLFTFPYWLLVGRNKQKKTADSLELGPLAPQVGVVASASASPQQGLSNQGRGSPQQGQASPRQGQASPRQGQASPRQGQASPRQGMAPVMGHSGVESAALQQVAAPAAAIAASVREKLADGTIAKEQIKQATADNHLEHSIDEALDRIKKFGEQKSNS